MRIVDADEETVGRLVESGIMRQMSSFESCKFFVLEEDGGRIIGACGLGGLFNVPSLQIVDGYQGRGIGKKLLAELIAEAGRRGYSFIAGSRNPENARAIKLHDFFGFCPVFRIRYAPDITRDVIILVLKPRGRLVSAFLRTFNNLAGTAVLALALKTSKPLLVRVMTLQPDELPDPSVSCMLRNFRRLPLRDGAPGRPRPKSPRRAPGSGR